MAEVWSGSGERSGERLNLEKVGKELNITSVDDEMRLLKCPLCNKMDVIKKKTDIAICPCGARITMKERWYE